MCLSQRARSRAVKDGGDSGSGVMAGICIKGHAVFRNRCAEESLPVATQRLTQAPGARYVDEGKGQQESADLDSNAAARGRRELDDPAQLRFGLLRALLRDDAPVDAETHAIRHNVGVDA